MEMEPTDSLPNMKTSFINHVSDSKLISRLFKELQHFKNSKIKSSNQFMNGSLFIINNDLDRYSKIQYKQPISIGKSVQHL